MSGGDERLRYRLAGQLVRAERDRHPLGLPPGRRAAQPRLQPQQPALAPHVAGPERGAHRPAGGRRQPGRHHHQRLRRGPHHPGPDSQWRFRRPVTPAWSIPTRRRSPSFNRFGPVHERHRERRSALQDRPGLQYTGRFGLDLVRPQRGPVPLPQGQRLRCRRPRRQRQERLLGRQPLRDRQLPHLRAPPGDAQRAGHHRRGQRGAHPGRAELRPGRRLQQRRVDQVRTRPVISEGDGTTRENNLVSFFTRADYTLDKKYTFGGSLRTDGSSRFGPNNRWGLFPAAVGGVAAERGVLAQGRVLRFPQAALQPRTHRQPGDQRLSVPGSGRQRQLRRPPGIAPNNLPNPDLKWETTASSTWAWTWPSPRAA